MGETARKLETRVKEHRQDYEKAQCNHVIDWEGAKVIDSERDKYQRWIKEAIWIKRKSPTMNRDEGAYQLSHVWTGLITTSPPSGKK